MNVSSHLPLFSNLFVFQIESLIEIHVISHKNKLFPTQISSWVHVCQQKVAWFENDFSVSCASYITIDNKQWTFFLPVPHVNKPHIFSYCFYIGQFDTMSVAISQAKLLFSELGKNQTGSLSCYLQGAAP